MFAKFLGPGGQIPIHECLPPPLLVGHHSFSLLNLYQSQKGLNLIFFRNIRSNYLISNVKLAYHFPAQIADVALH